MNTFTRLLAIALLLPLTATATVIVQDYHFETPQLVPEFYGDIVVMEDCRTSGTPGAPALPTYGVKLLLPPGETATSVRVIPGDPVLLTSSAQVAPNQAQVPFSYEGQIEIFEPDPAIYQRDQLYPEELATTAKTQFYRGHGLACFLLQPVQYNPLRGEVWWYPHLRVHLTTNADEEAATSFQELYRGDDVTASQLYKMVDNIAQLDAYPADDESRIEDMDMVIITNSALQASFQTLADFNNRRGIHTFIETTSWIYANVDGSDNQERIRNYIVDCYQNLGIEYALLGGDGDPSGGGNIIPRRGVYVTTHYTVRETDTNLPCDLYYGGLDGNWNSDGDGQYGEETPEEADFIAEVHVGRAAVDNTSEATNFVNKHIAYQQSPVVNDCDEVLLAGELLWDDDGGTWTFGRTYMEELRLGSSNHGYTTVGIDNPGAVGTLYDQYDYYPGEWSALSHLKPLLNGGVNYLNHLGHCNYNYMARFYNSDITTGNFTNNGVNHGFYIVYSQGCICGEFDNPNDDCISEYWTAHISTGAVAIISNSNYGWGYHYSTRGSSQYFDREFVDAIYGEDITGIARANDDSKVDCLPWITGDDMANRWCALELNLFGDPSLDIWTGVPGTLTANYNSAYVIGTGTFDVQVPGVTGALVALTCEGELVARDFTDGGGNVTLTLNPEPVDPGTMEIVITAHNYLEYSGSVSVIPPAGPYVVYESHAVNDANGELNPGESPWLDITVNNCGVEIATDVTLTITESDSYVTILDGTEFAGDIPAGYSSTHPNAFQIQALATLPDAHPVNFTLTASSPVRETWESTFTVIGHSPDLVVGGVTVQDGDNNRLDPGETADLLVTVDNDGTGLASNIVAIISSGDGYVTINDASSGLGSLPGGESGVLTYNITASPATPIGHVLTFDIDFTADGYTSSDVFDVAVGLTLEDFESGGFLSYDWEMGGNVGWMISADSPWEGMFCAQSGSIGDNQTSTLQLTTNVISADDISFYCRVSSEAGYDYLRFYIDGGLRGSWDGEQGWALQSYPVTAGEHTFAWTYEKDYSVSSGSDCGWVDYIIFPPLGALPEPAIAVDPEEFNVSVPDGGTDERILTITNYGEADLTYNLSLMETTRGFQDDMESGVNGWTHSGTNDLWHQTTHRSHSVTHSWYCGNEGSWEYANYEHCWLVSPQFYVESEADFTFYYWIDAEIYDAYQAWDGGIVELSLDGNNWTQITPAGGYPYTIYDNPDSPFPAGTPCYAGVNVGWSQASFDLSAYAGQNAQVRFRFGSDGYVVEEGWYIDDVQIAGITLDWLSVAPGSGTVPPASDDFVTVSFDATGYVDITLTGQITVLSNDPLTPELVLPVTLIVGGTPPQPIDDLTIQVDAPIASLSWTAVDGASQYHIYESSEPYGPWTLIGTSYTNSWSLIMSGERKFYQVTWE